MKNYLIKSLRYSYSNSFGDGSYNVTIERTDKGAKLTYEGWPKYKGKSHKISKEELEELEHICKKNKVDKWDGFRGEAVGVLDGDGFSLRIEFEERSMYAQGSNAYPKGYHDFIKDFEEFIKSYHK